jgi:hypothetical protein
MPFEELVASCDRAASSCFLSMDSRLIWACAAGNNEPSLSLSGRGLPRNLRHSHTHQASRISSRKTGDGIPGSIPKVRLLLLLGCCTPELILAEKIGDNPRRSGYRQILRVAGPIDHFMWIGERRGQPYQQPEADEHRRK